MKKERTAPERASVPLSRKEFLLGSAAVGLGMALPDGLSTPPPGISSAPSHSKESCIPPEVQITLLYTADIHAQLHTHDEFFWENGKSVFRKRGGLAVLKTMIQSLRQQNPGRTILIDGGDYFHGHGVASLTEGEALIPLFNNLGYDLMLPGNWEVVYKKQKMLYDMGHTLAAKICANMWHATDDEYNGDLIYPPYWIKVIDGIKLGFIGYTDHLIPKRQSPAYSKGIRFEHADKSVAKYVRYLRQIEGCHGVFLVTHMGLAQQVGLANNPVCQGVDFILGADTHERVRTPIQGKYTRVVECGAFGSFIGKLDLHFRDGKLSDYTYQLLDVDPAKYPPDPELQAMIQQVAAPFEKEMKRVIGRTSTPLLRYFVLETPMDNLITDAMMWKFKPDIALSNGFRFCQPLAVDPQKGEAEITKEFLWNMLPVDAEIKSGVVTGKQLWNWLEKELENAFAKDPSRRFGGWFVRFSGMQVNFTINNDFGQRLNWVKVKGEPLDLEREYTIIACEREGDPDDVLCRLEGVKNPLRTGFFMHAVLEEYLAAHPVVSPKLEGRAIATDYPPTLLTQLQGTSYEFH
ncbi:MAG: bifunctional metallophosphatase/5'-nucleotidase [Flavobacteriales bacterium]|nr:bifunctional metallophosphatase/5'-nucleotidase [Flavobacteriales bacterium]MCX7767712.1 bifunctional metallophosphatase/5'-nucleotidase [Flavobacteriales bacterium]MDW8409393.1 bifunctional metallophosphatase/5'-nucleotidase [Flavobacteriales bacterium]